MVKFDDTAKRIAGGDTKLPVEIHAVRDSGGLLKRPLPKGGLGIPFAELWGSNPKSVFFKKRLKWGKGKKGSVGDRGPMAF